MFKLSTASRLSKDHTHESILPDNAILKSIVSVKRNVRMVNLTHSIHLCPWDLDTFVIACLVILASVYFVFTLFCVIYLLSFLY